MRVNSRLPLLAGRAALRLSRWIPALCIVFVFLVARTTMAGTFGTVIPIAGHASDIALDESRGVIYVANFTANRIDIVSVAERRLLRWIPVDRQPASLSLSPDRRYLAISHVSNFEPPAGTPFFGITVMDLEADTKQMYGLMEPPLGLAFGSDGKALVITTNQFLLFDPVTGGTELVDTVQGVTTKTLPQPLPTSPREIIRASITGSGDGARIFGVAEMNDDETNVLIFEYSVPARQVEHPAWIASPPLGPRVVSTDQTGSVFMAGWGLFHRAGYLPGLGPFVLAQFPNSEGNLAVGSHAIDASRGTIYAQVTQSAEGASAPLKSSDGSRSAAAGSMPVLMITDWDNLTVREKLMLPENLSGRSILDSRGDVMYATSESGVMVLPVGALNREHRVRASEEDLLFRGQWCDRRAMTQEFMVENPGGGSTEFSIRSSHPAVTVSQSSTTTPARVQVSVDMRAFQNAPGTTQVPLTISSTPAINVIPPVRVLVNNREPDQRGTIFNVPGTLVDIQADAARNRFYVIREDRNEVRVFDSSNFNWIGTMRTGNTPRSMTTTPDGRFLITGADNSQVAHVFDLDTMQFSRYIVFPGGHYPRSIAASNRAILAASRVAGEKHTIDRIDFAAGLAFELPSLGIFENDIDLETVLAATPSRNRILAAEANGSVLLYDVGADTFVAGRKEYDKLQGNVSALSDDVFAVDRYLLNSSLVTTRQLDAAVGQQSGFALPGGVGLRTGAPTAAAAGVAQRLLVADGTAGTTTRLSEAPVLPNTVGHQFTPPLMEIPNGSGFVSLSTSGFTVLPSNFDAGLATARVSSVVSAADFASPVAPGGLITIYGGDLGPVSASAGQAPLPTLLGDTCVTINGTLVPLAFVSPGQINGQLPFGVAAGSASMVVHTPSGVSSPFQFPVQGAAPAVFLTAVDGWTWNVPLVIREKNNQIATLSNPIHLDDWVVIYLTGLGAVSPAVETGAAAPVDPLSQTIARPEVRLGGTMLPVGYSGLAPGTAGVYQINVKVLFQGVPTGMEVPLTITLGGYSTTVKVRVVD